ncbi:MAG: outer membrane lipoprotein carrier protein LolA, partial [Thermodesulfobacteriota bacterium]|nr:outer membrane lipoprotein carrier protein LolA [Thermodesulfobacteriota bacterium]
QKPGYRIAFILLMLTLFLTQLIPVKADDQLSGIIKGVQGKYRNLPGFTITYTREILSKSMAMLGEPVKSDLATGQIYFKPPHFLRLEQEKPKPETVITNGEILWWHIPHKMQVYRYPSHKLGEELRLLVDIFYGLRRAEDSFKIILMGPGDKREHRVRLTPDPPWPQVDHIDLSVVKEDYFIKIVEIHNYMGGITRFILGDLTEEEKLEEGLFRFVVPEGVKVIDGDNS